MFTLWKKRSIFALSNTKKNSDILFIVSKNTFEEKFLCRRQNLCDIDIIINAHAQQNFFNFFFLIFPEFIFFFYLNWSNLLLWHACIVHKSMIRKKLQSHYWKLSPVILQSFFRVLYCICRAFRASWSCKYNKTIGLGSVQSNDPRIKFFFFSDLFMYLF